MVTCNRNVCTFSVWTNLLTLNNILSLIIFSVWLKIHSMFSVHQTKLATLFCRFPNPVMPSAICYLHVFLFICYDVWFLECSLTNTEHVTYSTFHRNFPMVYGKTTACSYIFANNDYFFLIELFLLTSGFLFNAALLRLKWFCN